MNFGVKINGSLLVVTGDATVIDDVRRMVLPIINWTVLQVTPRLKVI